MELFFLFCKQKTAYEMRISDWSSDVCSSDLLKPAPSEPAPGEVLPLTAIQVNLAGGHYLRIGLALQLVEGAEEADGSKALDAAIEIFSGQKVSTVTDPEERDTLKDELTEAVREAYHEERSEERRVGKEGVRTFRSRWSPEH